MWLSCLVGAFSSNQKVVGSIPGLGAHRGQPLDASPLHQCFSLSLPFSLKAMTKCPLVRIKKLKEMKYYFANHLILDSQEKYNVFIS